MKILEFFDVMSPQASFNIGGRERVSSNLGGLFVILNACSILAFTGYSLVSYFQKVEPTVTESTMNSRGNPLSMHSYEMPIISIYAELPDGSPDLNMERYATVYLQLRERTGTKLKKTNFPYYRCSEAMRDYPERFKNIDNFEEYRDYISKTSLCLKDDDQTFPVFNDFHSPEDAHVRVYVNPCNLSAAECATEDEVKASAIYLAYVRTTFDMNDYKSPMRKEYIELDQLTPDIGVSQSIKFLMKKLTVHDNLGLPYKENVRTETSAPSDREAFNQNRINRSVICTNQSCDAYFKIKFIDSKLITKTYRVYKPFSEVLGEIGGVKEVIYWAFFILYIVIGGGAVQKEFIVKQVFCLKTEKLTCRQRCSRRLSCKKKQRIIDMNKKYQTDSKGVTEAPAEVIDLAYEYFEDSKDLITLAQSTYILNLLSSVLMTGYQRSISSMVMLNCYLKDQLPQTDEKVTKHQMKSPLNALVVNNTEATPIDVAQVSIFQTKTSLHSRLNQSTTPLNRGKSQSNTPRRRVSKPVLLNINMKNCLDELINKAHGDDTSAIDSMQAGYRSPFTKRDAMPDKSNIDGPHADELYYGDNIDEDPAKTGTNKTDHKLSPLIPFMQVKPKTHRHDVEMQATSNRSISMPNRESCKSTIDMISVEIDKLIMTMLADAVFMPYDEFKSKLAKKNENVTIVPDDEKK